MVTKSETSCLSDGECDYLVDLLNGVRGQALIQDLVNQHVRKIHFFCKTLQFIFVCVFLQRKELAELQTELECRVQALNERRRAVELLDKKLVSLVDEQAALSNSPDDDKLQELRDSLAARTEQELKEIEQRKQG